MVAILRSASVQDAVDVVRVLRASRLRFLPFAAPAHSERQHVEWARNILIPAGGVTVATIGDRIVGVLAVRCADGAHWIDQLYVEPEYCGRGVGSLLMEVVLSLGRPIRLYTFQQNGEARRFYERFGFVPVGWSGGTENEENCPDVLYELVAG